MTTTTEVRAGQFIARQRATSRVYAGLRSHRTLWAGVLYVITIIIVLAVLTRL